MLPSNYIFALREQLPPDVDWLPPGAKLLSNRVTLRASVNCAWIVERQLRERGIGFSISEQRPQTRMSMQALTLDSLKLAMLASQEIHPWVYDFLTPYQREGILFAFGAPAESATLWHPTGSGKSLEAIVWALLRPGTCVFLTRAAARRTIQLEVQRYTSVTPVVMWPPSELRKSDPIPNPIGARIVIAGYESLHVTLPQLLAAAPVSLIADEIHKAKAHKRFAAVPEVDAVGNDTKRFTPLDNISACVARLGRNASRRLGLTASPIADRLRDLWSQLDIVHPGAWGDYWSWARRYTDLTINGFGGWDDRGESNTEELKKRMSFVAHQIDYAVTHRDLPSKRRQVIFIDRASQNPPGAFAKELARARKLGLTHLQDVKLAEAASRKRSYLTDVVVEAVASGQKVVIFTGRHNDCTRLQDAVRKACPKAALWMSHGGFPTRVRDEAREAYMAAAGPAVFIGTGEAFGESLSLADTDLAIFAMLPINARQLLQWEGRFTRRGFTRNVLILYLIAEGSYDERVHSILLAKLPAVADVQRDSNFEEAAREIAGSDSAAEMQERLLRAVMENVDPLKEAGVEEETGR